MTPYEANTILVIITLIIGLSGFIVYTSKIVSDIKEYKRIKRIHEKYEQIRLGVSIRDE